MKIVKFEWHSHLILGNNNVVKKTDIDFLHQIANLLLEFIEKLRTERKLKKNTEYNRSRSIIWILFFLFLFMNVILFFRTSKIQ